MSLGPLQGRIWLHVGARPPTYAARLARRAGGIVLQGPISGARAKSIASLEVPLLMQDDGKERSRNSLLGANEDWLLQQDPASILTSRSAWVAAPSVPSASVLRAWIDDANRFLQLAARDATGRPALALLAVSTRWLSSRENCARLISALSLIDGPVGLMLGSTKDPLESPRTIEGLIELIHRLPRVALLRSDHAALGALAFGAAAASIGIGTGTRHFVPPTNDSYADVSDPTPRLLVPDVMAWWKGSKLAYYAGDSFFDDPCDVCQGASLARFQDEALGPEADDHSVATWTRICDDIVSMSPEARPRRWLQMCECAYDNLDRIEDRYDGLPHPPSLQLKAWLRFAGLPAV